MFNIYLPQNRGWWLSGWEPLFEWNWSASCAWRGDSWGCADPCLLLWASGQPHPQKRCLSFPQQAGNWKAPVGPLLFSAAGQSHCRAACLCSVLLSHLRADPGAAQQGTSTSRIPVHHSAPPCSAFPNLFLLTVGDPLTRSFCWVHFLGRLQIEPKWGKITARSCFVSKRSRSG